jgi:hypothetical protein
MVAIHWLVAVTAQPGVTLHLIGCKYPYRRKVILEVGLAERSLCHGNFGGGHFENFGRDGVSGELPVKS